MEQIKRYFIERKEAFRDEAEALHRALRDDLNLTQLDDVRLFARYDVAGVSDAHQVDLVNMVLSVPRTDEVYAETLPEDLTDWHVLAVESLPGQYDQRADSCTQCVEVITGERPIVRSAMVYAFSGKLTEDEQKKIEHYLVNPVESRLAAHEKPKSLEDAAPHPDNVPVLEGFTDQDAEGLLALKDDFGLAMDQDDLLFMQGYFKNDVKRNPTETELRMIDTYWSDHCRHTTFHTELQDIRIDDATVQAAFERYQDVRQTVYGEKAQTRPVTLMDLGTLATKYLKKTGKVRHLDESEEVNACSVHVQVDEDGTPKPWLFMFKNETHNHPTEIEPFGGASTCLGGAIRDPLSGRSYVHQGMRLTGAADPRTPLDQTRTGKLPQKKICTLAAQGFASYGNQIGVATGLVDEVYHPGYEAKRMEVGAVISAAPVEHVVREVPQPGDIVVLLGGRTGRDGVGGATGSSKTHTEESLETSSAEVQKGNPVEERKIQRLFRRADVAPLIKRCNDFGAGGVSVAIGELADGVEIFLDRIPTKYKGLNGTELALSESQERMACVIAKGDWPFFEAAALEENLESTAIANVTDDSKVTMWFQDQKIVELDRFFLDSAGAAKKTDVHAVAATNNKKAATPDDFVTGMQTLVQDLNICAKEGLTEQFDATVGAGTVLFPLGGKRQKTPVQTMAAKIPVENAETDTATLFAYGFDPAHSAENPYRGAYDAVVESVAKLMASGADSDDIYLSLQEYFHSLRNDPARWGEPFKAVLGALMAQLDLEIPAIGGKDSMSGSFEDLDVPPTLISFATTFSTGAQIISPEFKQAGNKLVRVTLKRDETGHIVTEDFKDKWHRVRTDIKAGSIVAGWAVNRGGIAEGLFKMALGNGLGAAIESSSIDLEELFEKAFGTLIFETTDSLDYGETIGMVTEEPNICFGSQCVDVMALDDQSQHVLADIYPGTVEQSADMPDIPLYTIRAPKRTLPALTAPKVVIPALPGTNCEYDTARAFRLAGADVSTVVIGNLTPERLNESVATLKKALSQTQILALPGGFSFGDEPDGSGKFVSAFFREPGLAEAIRNLLDEQDGLIIGICNGFQALVKLGLLPYGEIRDPHTIDATLTRNIIGRHQSRYVHTRIVSVASPWMNGVEAGEVHTIPVSHGEGRFVTGDAMMQQLIQNGQIATQYVDDQGQPSMDVHYNPNGSMAAIEGLLSPNGRILGKMGHSERVGKHIAKNIPGNKEQRIFESGVGYFRD